MNFADLIRIENSSTPFFKRTPTQPERSYKKGLIYNNWMVAMLNL